jgi:hypothetical protein
MREPDNAGRQPRYIREGREDVVVERTRNLPAWAEGNPHTYFRAAEKYERQGGNAFEEWKITLPQELSHAQNRALVDDLIDTIAGEHLPCTYAFHDPPTLDGTKQQPHIHLLISARMNDEHTRTAETHFKRYDRKQPERGGAQKNPAFWHKGAVKAYRLMVSDILNVHLERQGQGARVHPDSLESRGMDRQPEPKLLPSESQAYREKGTITETMSEVLQIRDARAKQPPREQNNARQYWEQRKVFLGITRDMSREAQVAHILLRRYGAVERVAARYRPLVERDRSRGVPREQVEVEQTIARAYQQTGRRRPARATGQSLAQQLMTLTRSLEAGQDVAGGGVRVRLYERERDDDRGLGW